MKSLHFQKVTSEQNKPEENISRKPTVITTNFNSTIGRSRRSRRRKEE